ncbi:MBL fold metallo-hydrolase [Streptomyces sp. HPF1205]|uniref:MBL fold metallo-hydrolase n=1 Tax=Streptomyces sp. HPF1205 TaxID=2873262 RepID=UPI001CEC579B|nr:MBL fold metallo-hydrolase [Streptomyces sp. HPF1205]
MREGEHLTAGTPGGGPVAAAVRFAGGPTAVLDVAGLRLLADPTADTLAAVTGPARRPGAGGPGVIHVVLLSHLRHTDGLDCDERRLFATVPLTLTTAQAAMRLGRNATALPAWYHLTLERPDGGRAEVTGIPVGHHRSAGGRGAREDEAGPATGFVLSGTDLRTVYLSGGNTSPEVFDAVARRFGPIDLALLPVAVDDAPLRDGGPAPTGSRAATRGVAEAAMKAAENADAESAMKAAEEAAAQAAMKAAEEAAAQAAVKAAERLGARRVVPLPWRPGRRPSAAHPPGIAEDHAV